MKSQSKHFIVYIDVLKLIMSFSMGKIHWIIDIIGQSVEPNKRTIEEPNEVLALNLCQL